MVAQFEVLPLGRGEEQAAHLPEPVALTVTCSPRQGPDRTVAVAERLSARGHTVTVHLAARMVRDAAHLDELLARRARAGVEDPFLMGPSKVTPDRVYGALRPHLDDAELNISGFHYYTFDQLVDTRRWERQRHAAPREEAVTR
jgi:methylenetetrahydrofolate reductase (NADPH)